MPASPHRRRNFPAGAAARDRPPRPWNPFLGNPFPGNPFPRPPPAGRSVAPLPC